MMLFVYGYHTYDPDLGWHLRAGEYFLKFGIPKTDIFSFTATAFAWINHEWLNDVIMNLLNTMGGKALLAVFFTAIWVLALYIASYRKSVMIALLAAISIMPFAGTRPIAWTVLFTALLVRILRLGRSRYQLVIPLIFLAWANLHGGFTLGILILAIWQVFSKNKVSYWVVITSLLAVFVNPYGPRIFVEIFSTLTDSQLKFRISEWMPIKLPLISTVYLIIYLALYVITTKDRIKGLFSLSGLTLFMALSSIKYFPIFVVISFKDLENYQQIIKQRFEKLKPVRHVQVIAYSSLVVLVAVPGLMTAFSLHDSLNSYGYYPVKIVNKVKQSACNKNIFNSYNYGGFLIYELPEYKYYIDGRMPSWRLGQDNYFNNYEKMFKDKSYRNEQFDKYDINCAIIGFDSKIDDELRQDGWKVQAGSAPNGPMLYTRP